VICPLPVDANTPWGNTHDSTVEVRFRTGSVSGRIICSVFNGAAGAQDQPVVTTTTTSIVQPANSAVSALVLTVPPSTATPGTYSPVSTVSVACILGPKIKLGGLFLDETVATQAQ
jgi:hypothetical protein